FPIKGELDGVIFYDGGSVFITGQEFIPAYRHSAGLGFRYNTPVGPVSFEYGFIIGRQSGEGLGRLHLSIGTF
ncbi:MAG: BamA/TamA family outer membrane protein, partial [Bdellovibrionales bacterium]|nr:BamA/TamA family outer membrane protein [Bdellovibrionales bacterium]